MDNQYIDLIQQTYHFPQEGFKEVNGELHFCEVPIMDIIKEHGTPLRLSYLPKINSQIQKAKGLFNNAFEQHGYKGKYVYTYCTKASHFSFIVKQALKNDVHLETSSAFDIDLIERLYVEGAITKDTFIVCNGYKTERYLSKISNLINNGYSNVIPVLDNMNELDYYEQHVNGVCNIGMRIAADEEPNFEFYTSRLGIRYKDIIRFYEERIKPNSNIKLKMLHFFINTGIKDNVYYWNELRKAVNKYCELKKVSPGLEYVNIGGGLPIKNSLGFEYDYEYMVSEIVLQIKNLCSESEVPEPDIFSEFGSHTVGESGAMLFKVLGQKLQNDKERWFMIDGSLMTTLPDIWGLSQRFILLPINRWHHEYQRVSVGGLSCDKYDYYNADELVNEVFLPKLSDEEPLYIGFFHIGAYQESLSGYGGTKHCLIPSPKHVMIDRDADGNITSKVFANEQEAEQMLGVLGY